MPPNKTLSTLTLLNPVAGHTLIFPFILAFIPLLNCCPESVRADPWQTLSLPCTHLSLRLHSFCLCTSSAPISHTFLPHLHIIPEYLFWSLFLLFFKMLSVALNVCGLWTFCFWYRVIRGIRGCLPLKSYRSVCQKISLIAFQIKDGFNNITLIMKTCLNHHCVFSTWRDPLIKVPEMCFHKMEP